MNTVITDVRIGVDDFTVGTPYTSGSDDIVDYYRPEVVNAYDYYAFGWTMPGRKYDNAESYRQGFNGMENDKGWTNSGSTHLDFGARIYDARIAIFQSLDPYASEFLGESNYSFAGDNPISNIDKNGEYKVSARNLEIYRQKYPLVMKYLETMVENDIARNTILIEAIQTLNPHIQTSTIKGVAKWGFGPEISIQSPVGEFPREYPDVSGYNSNEHVIQLNQDYIAHLEQVLGSSADDETKLVEMTRFYMLLSHETVHELDRYIDPVFKKGYFFYTLVKRQSENKTAEAGFKVEEMVWGDRRL